jgi:hypothetical protein
MSKTAFLFVHSSGARREKPRLGGPLGLILIAMVSAALLWPQPCWAQLRTWTDKTGQLQVEAEVVSFQPGKVWLRRADGEVFGIDLAELSKADQQFIDRFVDEKEAEKRGETARLPGRIPYARPRKLCELASARIDESSGLACSPSQSGVFWTHNDSGDDARIYAFDSAGSNLGSCRLEGVQAYDWEDMVSFTWDGKRYLLVCDVGNNGRAAAVQILYVVEEPSIDSKRGVAVEKIPVLQTIYYSYEDDHRDCEAVAVDPTDRTLLFVTKERDVASYVYAMAWPKSDPTRAFVARRIGKLHLTLVTAMDVSPDGRRAVVLTYGNAYEYVRRPGEDWAHAFSRAPREIVMPMRVQGESICYGQDGKTLYLTSEKLPTPLWEVGVESDP